VGFDSSLREEAKGLAGIGAFLDSEDLYFQTLTPMVSKSMKLQPAKATNGA
jgi:hypothetical protein